MPKHNRCKMAGFTLVEMLIVLFIMGALLLIIVPNVMQAGVDAQQKACDANKKMIMAQVDQYFLSNRHQYPGSVDDLVNQGYLQSTPHCPMRDEEGHDYQIAEDGQVFCLYHDA